MNRSVQLWVYWVGTILVLSGLHQWLRWDTFSLVSFPLVLAVLMAFTIPRPWGLFLLVMTLAELGSHLAPGTLAVAIILPACLAYVPQRPASGLSWSFLGYVTLIMALQTAWLILWPLVLRHQGIGWTDIPSQLLAVMLSSAAAAFVAIMVWREWIEPLPHHKTIPRYKR